VAAEELAGLAADGAGELYALGMSQVRRTGDNIWRPGVTLRLAWLVTGAALMAGTLWLVADGDLSRIQLLTFAAATLVGVVLLPVVLFRWRMVLERDELLLVFLSVRRLPLSEVVGAKMIAREGLTFVCEGGREESFGALGNTAWGHKSEVPTRADLAARTILIAAAEARGEVPPLDYRLPPMGGLKKAALRVGIWTAIVSLILGD